MIDYEKLLNPGQIEAVTTLDGPVLVVAGAGSGKTRTLVFRLARLVESGLAPERVLLLTFTRKAAEEMLSRAGRLAEASLSKVAGGTFHSLAHLWLRRLAPKLGYPRDFHILDRPDSEAVIKALMEEKGLKFRLFPKKGTLAQIFSRAANGQVDLLGLIESNWPQFIGWSEEIVGLQQEYQDYKKNSGLMDFDDLLVEMIRLMESDEEVRAEVAGRYSHLMVDEYQDTNPPQARLVRLLTTGHDNVMAVGDDSQSIYAFRGADFRNMMDFPDLFPGARIVKLERNYRSTQPVLDMANDIIAQAKETFTKCLKADRSGQEKPVFFEASDESDQSLFVVDQIGALMGEGFDRSEIAVLFRAGFHSFDLEVQLNRAHISFAKYGGFKFVEAAHIKDVLAFLKARLNRQDILSLTRMLMLVPGVGPKRCKQVIDWLGRGSLPLKELGSFPGRTKVSAPALARLGELMAELDEAEMRGPAAEVARVIEYYRPIMEERWDDHPRRLVELEQVANLAHNYRSAYRFLADLTLDPPTTAYSGQASDERLVLSTVHSAKGLEWRAVFIIWATEGHFPSSRSLGEEAAVEEERRLMYVAVTRAKERLYLIAPRRSYSQHQGELFHAPSRFLEEARGRLSQFKPVPGPRTAPAGLSSGKEEAFSLPPTDGLAVGTLVSHPAFGQGRVAGYLGQKRVVIYFPELGHKTLHLDYAPLAVV